MWERVKEFGRVNRVPSNPIIKQSDVWIELLGNTGKGMSLSLCLPWDGGRPKLSRPSNMSESHTKNRLVDPPLLTEYRWCTDSSDPLQNLFLKSKTSSVHPAYIFLYLSIYFRSPVLNFLYLNFFLFVMFYCRFGKQPQVHDTFLLIFAPCL